MSTTKEPAYLVENSEGVGIYGHPLLHNDETLIASAKDAETAMAYADTIASETHVYGITYKAPWDKDDLEGTRVAYLDLTIEDDEALIAIAYQRHGGSVGAQLQSILEGDNLFDQNPNALSFLPALLRERNEYPVAEALQLFLQLEDAGSRTGEWERTLRRAELKHIE